MKFITLCGTACAALGFLLPTLATAQGIEPVGDAPAKAERVAFVATPVDTDKLSGYRGGTDMVRNDMTLNGTTADNSARNVNTGDNTISAGSFANMNGLPVVIQNSGANVLIQNAVILHLQMN